MSKEFIPSYTSPKGGRRACLCKDKLTYSIECCTGELHAQGIGRITGPEVLLLESGGNILQEDNLNILV
jgi:hypothetical protein